MHNKALSRTQGQCFKTCPTGCDNTVTSNRELLWQLPYCDADAAVDTAGIGSHARLPANRGRQARPIRRDHGSWPLEAGRTAHKGAGQAAGSPVQVCVLSAGLPLLRKVLLVRVRGAGGQVGKSSGCQGEVCTSELGVRENESCEVVDQCGRLSAVAVDVMYLVHSHRRVCHWHPVGQDASSPLLDQYGLTSASRAGILQRLHRIPLPSFTTVHVQLPLQPILSCGSAMRTAYRRSGLKWKYIRQYIKCFGRKLGLCLRLTWHSLPIYGCYHIVPGPV